MSQIKKYWKSFEDRSNESLRRKNLNEFPNSLKGHSVLKDTKVSRRNFIKTMGASLMLAGVSGCSAIRKPEEKIYPYVESPENLVPGDPTYYATSYYLNGESTGLLVKSLEGRPTKIEGNPLHPHNLGKTNSFHQASVLGLYDPDRISQITSGGEKKNKVFLKSWINKAFLNEGKETAFLIEENASLTFWKLLSELKDKYPQVKIYQYKPRNNNKVYKGIKKITGREAYPVVNFKKVDRVVSLDSDFLGIDSNSLKYNREFMEKRDLGDGKEINRLYQFENSFSITGGVADHRFVLKRNDVELIAYAILNELYQKSISRINRFLISKIEEILLKSVSFLKSIEGYRKVNVIVKDLLSKPGKSVVVAGSHLSPFTHSLVFYINKILSAPITYYERSRIEKKIIPDLEINALLEIKKGQENNSLKNLVVLSGDPAYNGFSDISFKETYGKLSTLYLGESFNETAKLSKVVIPQKNYLEDWSDNTSSEGVFSIVQPLITPLFPDSFSKIDLINLINKNSNKALTEVKKIASDLGFDWKKLVHEGFVQTESLKRNVRLELVNLDVFIRKAIANKDFYIYYDGIEVALNFDYSVYDGRFINNAWLQELPDPITKLTWDNAILISHPDAKKFKVKNYDLISLEIGGYQVEGAVWILPGQAENSITLKLGYGQTSAGLIGVDSGYSTYPLFFSDIALYRNEVKVKKLNKQYIVASVQDHWTIEDGFFEGEASSNSQNGRPLYRETSLEEYSENPRFARDEVKVPTLKEEHDRVRDASFKRDPMYADKMSVFDEKKYDEGYQWGMTINLSTCTGCNACVVACQAENNIPVVGKEMVLQGREMHWIRLDRYFEGDVNNPKMVHQPVNCMQCENAPCEQVCPVNATVHSKEGLNDMVYNRCIGTRFCSNNCPFKVRRFNFFDYHQKSPHSQKKVSSHVFELFREPKDSLQLQFNPDVTVRMRGVMEKCTYCVQRINKARVKSKNEDRLIEDGEIKTACQEACPTSSIVFGDINDPSTEVSRLKKQDRNYHLLAELNLKPRTTYLASINNPNKEIK